MLPEMTRVVGPGLPAYLEHHRLVGVLTEHRDRTEAEAPEVAKAAVATPDHVLGPVPPAAVKAATPATAHPGEGVKAGVAPGVKDAAHRPVQSPAKPGGTAVSPAANGPGRPGTVSVERREAGAAPAVGHRVPGDPATPPVAGVRSGVGPEKPDAPAKTTAPLRTVTNREAVTAARRPIVGPGLAPAGEHRVPGGPDTPPVADPAGGMHAAVAPDPTPAASVPFFRGHNVVYRGGHTNYTPPRFS
jgi:hypothetical protein